ncbi:MAG: hypothetical protein CL927_00880 [Deltaproteobacteria bacterium]|nr:hypothetical protein [Deltaproteobacteria bacterium]HCH61452.1 hypothetical protein [Deltaproteobacteria bacterium]
MSQTLHYKASSALHAIAPLSWIQETQAVCFLKRGAYCSTLGELLELREDGEARSQILRQLENNEHRGEGSRYFYRLVATPEMFEATASCCSGLARGADIWQIGPEGEPTAMAQSSIRDGLASEATLRAILLLTLIIQMAMLSTTAWRWYRQRPSLARGVGSMVFVVFGILLPVILSAILAA